MDSRTLLFIGFLLVSFLLFQQWQTDYGPQQPAPGISQTVVTDTPEATDPSVSDIPRASAQTQSLDLPTQISTGNTIRVVTDSLEVLIDPVGGDVISSKLLNYPLELDGDVPVQLMQQDASFVYVAQSGLIGADGVDNAKGRARFSAEQDSYQLTGDTLDVPLTLVTESGVTVTKHFIFTRGLHSINVKYAVINPTDQPLQLQLFAQLKQSVGGKSGGSMMMPTYRGTAYSTADERYEKYDFDTVASANLSKQTQGGWIAMLEHYFVSAWVPNAEDSNLLYTRMLANNQAAIGFKGPLVSIPAGAEGTLSTTLFTGPKYQDELSALSPTLNLTVDYGFLWWLAQPLHWLLSLCYALVSNWGAAIILVTLLVKTAMYPLTKKQYTSMAKMRLLQPKLVSLKERFGDDRQKMSQAMMELYQKEKVNPLGGCLPLLLQMPIFLALYWVLLESVELRQASFALWIDDLSVQDPYYVLPLLMGASMFLMQKLSPNTATDPMQQKMMQWMPVIFTVFFLWFPAGLVLYWLFSNLISIAQQWMINKQIEKQGLKASR